jgi:hypothetical protein
MFDVSAIFVCGRSIYGILALPARLTRHVTAELRQGAIDTEPLDSLADGPAGKGPSRARRAEL